MNLERSCVTTPYSNVGLFCFAIHHVRINEFSGPTNGGSATVDSYTTHTFLTSDHQAISPIRHTLQKIYSLRF